MAGRHQALKRLKRARKRARAELAKENSELSPFGPPLPVLLIWTMWDIYGSKHLSVPAPSRPAKDDVDSENLEGRHPNTHAAVESNIASQSSDKPHRTIFTNRIRNHELICTSCSVHKPTGSRPPCTTPYPSMSLQFRSCARPLLPCRNRNRNKATVAVPTNSKAVRAETYSAHTDSL